MTTEIRPPQSIPTNPTNPPGNAQPVNCTWIILRKEFSEIFRDRRTVMSVVISPLFITPALFALMGTLISNQTQKAQTQTYNVGVIGAEAAPSMMQAMRKLPNIRFETLSGGTNTRADAEKRIKNRALSAVAILPDDAEMRIMHGNTVPIEILIDAGSESSHSASGRLNAGLNLVGQELVKSRLARQNLPTEFATPFKVSETPIAEGGSNATFILAMMLPYILVISTFSGAIYAAFDQVAGEKERGTLETLLVAPASRRDIVLGKFGAVVGVCLISSILSIVGLIFSFSIRSKAFEWLSKGGLHLSPTAVIVTLLVMLPLAVLFAGLLLAVSTFARNQKEAQTYLAPLFMVVLLPAMSSMFMTTEAAKTTALIPILNASIIIKQALSGSYDPVFIGLAFAVSVVYAALALTIATRLFQKESVLIKA